MYNAVDRTVACEPFVRTFVRMANERSMTEVTPTVNAGGRLPKGPLAVARGHERPACVVVLLGRPDGADARLVTVLLPSSDLLEEAVER